MSSFAAVGVLLALGVATTYTVYVIDKMLWDRFNWISIGVVQGVSISIEHRRLLFYRAWLFPAFGVLGYQIAIAIGWILAVTTLGTMAVTEEVQLLGYMCAFIGVIGVLFVGYQAFFGYFQLASVLRQAEAD
jgi:hypothetical protein